MPSEQKCFKCDLKGITDASKKHSKQTNTSLGHISVSMGLVSPREANLHYSIIPICRSAPSITIKHHTGVPYKADVGGQRLAKHGFGYFVANRFRGDLEMICVCCWGANGYPEPRATCRQHRLLGNVAPSMEVPWGTSEANTLRRSP